jgi:hypothetical protein
LNSSRTFVCFRAQASKNTAFLRRG